jgi:hypothetical protein
MFPVDSIEGAGRTGVRFVADGITVEAVFASVGEVAGHVRLMKEGRVLADGPLRSQLEDHYGLWNAVPRFHDWTTNPAMRAVMKAGAIVVP